MQHFRTQLGETTNINLFNRHNVVRCVFRIPFAYSRRRASSTETNTQKEHSHQKQSSNDEQTKKDLEYIDKVFATRTSLLLWSVLVTVAVVVRYNEIAALPAGYWTKEYYQRQLLNMTKFKAGLGWPSDD